MKLTKLCVGQEIIMIAGDETIHFELAMGIAALSCISVSKVFSVQISLQFSSDKKFTILE